MIKNGLITNYIHFLTDLVKNDSDADIIKLKWTVVSKFISWLTEQDLLIINKGDM